MKTFIRISISAVLLASCLCSCSKWLEATSSDKISADHLFETKDGFKDALSGVYLSMGDKQLYGGNTTWFGNDLAAYPYVIQSVAYLKDWQTHSYSTTNTKPKIEAIWQSGYNAIANINMILRALDEHPGVMTDYEKNLFRGELYGLRAQIHFDLMRMFGLDSWDGENASKVTVPYVTSYSKEPAGQLSYESTAALLLEDIKNSISLLENDPVRGTVPDNFTSTLNVDGYWSQRTRHFNYYAAKSLYAEVLLWQKEYDKAASEAQEVLDEVLGRKVVSWLDCDAFLKKQSNEERDWTFSSEHIFTLECYSLMTDSAPYLTYSDATSGGMRVNASDVSGLLFPPVDPQTSSPSGAEDVRGTAAMLKFTGLGYLSYKLYGTSSTASSLKNIMPMIKLADLYYIIADAKIAGKDNEGALAVLDIVRSHRGIGDTLPKTADAKTELMKECYREFINEGKMFYWLKHEQVTNPLISTLPVTYKDLVYPYPEDELNYGRKQEL